MNFLLLDIIFYQTIIIIISLNPEEKQKIRSRNPFIVK